ncbi:unnamed protein product [Pedinophyceae sp. YPF-701]|nr:unnamed protein product [Pedinophyceae sp. YPF-701]
MSSEKFIDGLVLELSNPNTREHALLELSKKRETFPDLAPYLWHSHGTIAALLQEIVSIYPMLSPPTLSAQASNRVCNALALLQCVASHQDTRALFLSAQIPLFLYPFLNTMNRSRPFEYLRLTSLGVIGALVKVDDRVVIDFLLGTQMIPLCLRTMECGSELSKTVATFIIQKILLDDSGLSYVCMTGDRFFRIHHNLALMLFGLQQQPSSRLFKHIVRCYLRLSDNHMATEAMRRSENFVDYLCHPALLEETKEDATTRRWLVQLLLSIGAHDHARNVGAEFINEAMAANAQRQRELQHQAQTSAGPATSGAPQATNA